MTRHHMACCFLVVVMLGVLAGVGTIVGAPAPGGHVLASTDNPEENRTAPTAAPEFDTTERLILPPANFTVDDGTASVDPGQATSVGFFRLQAEYDAHLLESRLEAANSSEEQVEILRDDVAELAAALDAAHHEERMAHEAFVAGDKSAVALLARMGVIHERSIVLQDRFDHQVDTLRGVTATAVQDEVTRLRGEISQHRLEADTLQGPIRADAFRAVGGSPRFADDTLVQASTHGYVLATIDDGIFIRESNVILNRDRAAGESFRDTDDGRERTAALYPWTFEESIGTQDLLRGDIYWASLEHRHGTTTTFVDGATKLPFREIHQLRLFELPTGAALEASEDGYDILLTRTYAGGPAHLALMVEGTDQPVDGARVRIDGRSVGATSEESGLWFLTPDSTLELTILVDGNRLTFDVEIPVGEPTET